MHLASGWPHGPRHHGSAHDMQLHATFSKATTKSLVKLTPAQSLHGHAQRQRHARDSLTARARAGTHTSSTCPYRQHAAIKKLLTRYQLAHARVHATRKPLRELYLVRRPLPPFSTYDKLFAASRRSKVHLSVSFCSTRAASYFTRVKNGYERRHLVQQTVVATVKTESECFGNGKLC
eukprot:4619701-Pleurochrysis_carterae.AAC.3